jgi:hypothetical protein
MKRSLGLLSIGSIAVAAMVALSIQAGCASDEDPATSGGSGGGTAGTAGSTTGGTGGGSAGVAGTGGGTAGTGGGSAGQAGTGGGSSNCPVGQSATIADVADGTVATDIQVDIKGAIATTKKMVVYFKKSDGNCLWGVFVKDPNADRGMMVISYGDNAPADSSSSECPTGTDAIAEGIVPGDVLDIVGETAAYAPSSCTNGAAKQKQISACSVVKTGSGAAPEPVVVSNLDDLAAGAGQYQGLLVKIENVDAENYDGGTVGPYGVIELQGTELQINDKFYYGETGAPDFDPSQHFNSIVGINHLDYCDWVLQPRDKCDDFDPSSKDCL